VRGREGHRRGAGHCPRAATTNAAPTAPETTTKPAATAGSAAVSLQSAARLGRDRGVAAPSLFGVCHLLLLHHINLLAMGGRRRGAGTTNAEAGAAGSRCVWNAREAPVKKRNTHLFLVCL